MRTVITISREFGSGGHTIGEMVSRALDVPFYDQKLIEKTMADTGFSEKFIREAGEYAVNSNSLLFRIATTTSTTRQSFLSNYDKVYLSQNRIIRELAAKTPCVIVGRCADYILRNNKNCLNVFIHADMESRKKRVRERYGEWPDQSVEARILDKDKKQSLYYRHYTGMEWGDAKNYHLSMDSSALGIDRCVAWIVELAKQS